MGFGWDLQRTCNEGSTKAKQPSSRIAYFHRKKKIIFSYKGKRNFKIVVTAFCK